MDHFPILIWEEGIDKMWEHIKKIKNRNEVSSLIRMMEDPVICEVGVRTGDYFKHLLTENVKLAVGVDIWTNTPQVGQNDNQYSQKEIKEQYIHVFRQYFGDPRVKLIREFSEDACDFFDDETFDFIYI